MSDIKHHLSDAMLMGYAAGTLPEAFSLMVAAHVSLCDACRAQLESYNALGGEVIDTEALAAEMNADAFAETMRLIDSGAPNEIRIQRKPGVLPQPLQDYVLSLIHI